MLKFASYLLPRYGNVVEICEQAEFICVLCYKDNELSLLLQTLPSEKPAFAGQAGIFS
jgi:hypothetical protein